MSKEQYKDGPAINVDAKCSLSLVFKTINLLVPSKKMHMDKLLLKGGRIELKYVSIRTVVLLETKYKNKAKFVEQLY